MPTPKEFRLMAETARQQAADYRADAIGSKPERQSMLRQWASSRDEYAEFYERQADEAEARAALNQTEEAA